MVSQVAVSCTVTVLGQHSVSSKLCTLSPVSMCVLDVLGQSHLVQRNLHSAAGPSTVRCPYVVGAPPLENHKSPLCAATFKFRCHFIFLFSWSLAFSRPKNGPDRITGSHSAVKRRSQRTARHATTWQRRHRVSDGPSAPLPHIQSPNNPLHMPVFRSYLPSTQLTMPC